MFAVASRSGHLVQCNAFFAIKSLVAMTLRFSPPWHDAHFIALVLGFAVVILRQATSFPVHFSLRPTQQMHADLTHYPGTVSLHLPRWILLLSFLKKNRLLQTVYVESSNLFGKLQAHTLFLHICTKHRCPQWKQHPRSLKGNSSHFGSTPVSIHKD
jgi:hypothetical protein